MRRSKEKLRRLADMLMEGYSSAQMAEELHVCEDTIYKWKKHRDFKAIMTEMVSDDGWSFEYSEGRDAYPGGQCPYSKLNLRAYCAWMAGYVDAERGMV